MTYTYSSTSLGTILAKVRLEVGDTDSTAPLFTDEELQVYIDARGTNVLLASADACDALAVRYARAFDFETDGQKFSRSQMAKMYREMAGALRARGRGITSSEVTRKDGYSDDVDNITPSSSATTSNPRQRYTNVGGLDRLP